MLGFAQKFDSAYLAKMSGGIDGVRCFIWMTGRTLCNPGIPSTRRTMADRRRAWRLENLACVAERLQKKVRDRGLALEVKPLPTGLGLCLVEAASREDNDEQLTLWANLLANHSDPQADIELDKDLIEVVRLAEALALTPARLENFIIRSSFPFA